MSNVNDFSRRQFLQNSTALVGAALIAPLAVSGGASGQAQAAVKRTAIDQVTLGKTGIKLSRLGMGTGVDNGRVQAALGKEAFIKMMRHGYDRGLTYIDTCERYVTFPWIADTIKELPREKVFLLSKVSGLPTDVLAQIDSQRKTCNTDYFDTLLIHSQIVAEWSKMDSWKRVMDAFDTAKERKWLRAKGVSCHNLPALQDANATDFNEVHLVRVNPQGKYIDGPGGRGYNAVETNPVEPVLAEIKAMKEKGRGVIGMKICGNGLFTSPEDREKSIRFAMSNRNIDAVVIGFKATQEIDEAIERIDRALAEG